LRKQAGHYAYSGGKIGFGKDDRSRLAWSEAQKKKVNDLDQDLLLRVANVRHQVYHSDKSAGGIDLHKMLQDFDSLLRHMWGFETKLTQDHHPPAVVAAEGFCSRALRRVGLLWRSVEELSAARSSSQVCLLDALLF